MSLQREKLLQKFNEEYNRLNEQQRKAVDALEGPVMVIAGPGTGKTQILSARIGKILLSDAQIEPSNILCLTYTDAGVTAMRRRLQQFIGPDAYRVNIYTFHAFCNDVIQENLGLFEKTSLDPVSDLERVELLKELIDGFPKDHPLKRYRGDVYFEISNLQSLFSLMKKEGWTGDHICCKIDEYINDLATREEYICKRATKEFKKGDVRIDKIEEQREKMEKLRAACNEFATFQTMMRQRGRYDFDDMITWVIEAFGSNENLLRNYQEQFQYILVDEYQDTSGSQNKIVEQLISFWDKPNVFVVGDDDQSIYRFQGANVENMHAFASGFQKDLLTVVLTNNYRSTQGILDVSKSLIDRNQERLVNNIEGLTKDLLSAHDEVKHLKHLPVIKEYRSQQEEMIGLVLDVEKLLAAGVAGHNIGIIYRENKYGDELARYFRLRNVPFYSRRNLNILGQPIVRQLMMVLDYLAAEHDTPFGGDGLLFEILHFEWFGIPALEIAKASVQVSDLNYKGYKTSLRQWVCDKKALAPKDLFDTGLCKELCETVQTFEGLIKAVSNETVQGLLEKVIREGGFLSHIMHSDEKHWLLQLINGFYNHVKAETARSPFLELAEFLNRIDLMRREGLFLPLVQVAGNERGVNLMTCHGSKGLEFEHVFFAGVTSGSWEKKRKPYSGFSFPDTLFVSSAKGNDMEELRRLFYVALTRAKKHLHVSFAAHNSEGKELEPSQFLAEIAEGAELPRRKITIDEEVIFEFSILHFKQAIAPEIAHMDDDLTDRFVAGFVMNVSALNNYLRCPLEFYFRNIVRIPSPKNEAAEFGSAVHHALEKLFQKMQAADNVFPPVETFVADFAWYMNRNRQYFTKEQFLRRMEYGVAILTNYYKEYIHTFNKVVLLEHNLRNVMVGDLRLKGKIDKIEFNGKEVSIWDYKTGDPEKSREKFARPNPKIPAGGDYWRQAVFYKLMVENYAGKDWKVIQVAFDFIEPTKKREYIREKIIIGDEDIRQVKEQIKTVYEKIENRDFYTGCGREECHWCGFVKTNKMAVALHELNTEEEENDRRPMLRIAEL
jgi:DNA helicase-2/ATP-dependent DNA helicase PcrA